VVVVDLSAEEATLIKQRAAVLAKHLATLRLTPQHAAISVRMAITRNIDAHNYGVASGLLQVSFTSTFPQPPSLSLYRLPSRAHRGSCVSWC
jgi:hypothetical protein